MEGCCAAQAVRAALLLLHMQELRYPGIVMNAAMLVFGTAASLLAAHSARLITVTDQFRNGEWGQPWSCAVCTAMAVGMRFCALDPWHAAPMTFTRE